MKTYLLVLLTVLGFLSNAQTYDLTIHVGGIKLIDKSQIMIAVYNNADGFLKSDMIYKKIEVNADSSAIEYTFLNLEEGVYAVSLYHDEDNDDEMDRKWYGPPKEGYGFSNNFSSNIRPARFDDASFELNENKTIEIKIVY